MTLKELELFYALAEDPHISQLATKLSISQSAISLAIKSLEKKLAEPLFDRLGKKLVLNERGRLFYDLTHPHFIALKDNAELFSKERLSGKLKIASSKTIGEFIMPQIVFDFIQKYPDTTIEKTIQNSSAIIQMVQNAKIDLGIIEIECNEPNIIKKSFAKDSLVVVTNDKKLENKKLFIDELFDKKWILREKGSGTRDLFLRSLGDVAKELDIAMEYTEFEEMKTLLEQNSDTISCISSYVVAKELKRGELFRVELKNIDLSRELYIIYHQDKYKTMVFNSFIDYILEEIKKF